MNTDASLATIDNISCYEDETKMNIVTPEKTMKKASAEPPSSEPPSSATCEGKGLMMNRVAIDLIEFHCHKILVDGGLINNSDISSTTTAASTSILSTPLSMSPSTSDLKSPLNDIGEYFTQLDQYLSLIKDNDECVYSNGRLNSRLNLVSLIYDVFSIHRSRGKDKKSSVPSSNDGQENNATDSKQHNTFFSSCWQDEDWKRLEEQLALAKSAMLCNDANRCVLPAETKAETENEKAGQRDGSDCQKTHLFEKDYQQLVCSLKVHAKIARFYHSLKELQELQEKKEAGKKDHQASTSSFMEHLARIIADYATGLNKIFHDEYENYVAGNTDAKDQEGDDMNDGNCDDDINSECNDGNPSVASTTKVLTDLVSFLLPVFYQKKNNRDDTSLLLDRLIKHVETQIMHNPKSEFSYERVEAKFRALLHQWSNEVLDLPILAQHQQQQNMECADGIASSSSCCLSDVQLDITARTVDGEFDDEVSSWGGDDDGELLLRSLEFEEEEGRLLVGNDNDACTKPPATASKAHADEDDNRTIVTAVSASNSCYSNMMDCVSLAGHEATHGSSHNKRKRYGSEDELAEDEPIPVLWLYNNAKSALLQESVNDYVDGSAPSNTAVDTRMAKHARRISTSSISMLDAPRAA